MEVYLEALLELGFCTEPPNFGVEAHMEAAGEDALSLLYLRTGMAPCKSFFPRKP
jgi:hypothetical protein